MIYAISDIHGYYREFTSRIDQIGDMTSFENGENKLILLGDYIDRGPESKKVLEKIFGMQQYIGNENLVVLRGNHEDWLLDFLNGKGHEWLVGDEDFNTTKTFLTEEQLEKVKEIATIGKANIICSYIRTCIKTNYKELISWLSKLPYYYETENQIFVHAGIDEDAEDLWKFGTPEYVFTGKYPATTGRFDKDIIAGHVSAATVAGNKDFKGIYYDGESHFYIDGAVEHTGNLIVLAYDETTRKYYNLEQEDRNLIPRESRHIVRGNLTLLN